MPGNVMFCLENWNASEHLRGLRLGGGGIRSFSRLTGGGRWERP